jgi:hypothetical protein
MGLVGGSLSDLPSITDGPFSSDCEILAAAAILASGALATKRRNERWFAHINLTARLSAEPNSA